jgi:hypothetical protein
MPLGLRFLGTFLRPLLSQTGFFLEKAILVRFESAWIAVFPVVNLSCHYTGGSPDVPGAGSTPEDARARQRMKLSTDFRRQFWQRVLRLAN